jgi:two-component system response regulator CpxR
MTVPPSGPPRNRLLIIDDDIAMCELLMRFLRAEGFEVDMSHSGEQGVHRVLNDRFDLVMLDIMLPGMSGLDVLRRVRAESAVPVLMLTAKGEDVDRIVGLELGADDYLPKPFNTRELLARIHAILRRARSEPSPASQPSSIIVGDVELDANARTVRRSGAMVELTGVEFDLLHMLLAGAGRVVARETLFKQVLGRRPMPEDRSLDMHISNLRKKLGHAVGDTERIKTIRGQGYIYTRIEATGAG